MNTKKRVYVANVIHLQSILISIDWVHVFVSSFGTDLIYWIMETCTPEPKVLLPRMITSSLIWPLSSAISRLRSWYRVCFPSLPLWRKWGGEGKVPFKNNSCYKRIKQNYELAYAGVSRLSPPLCHVVVGRLECPCNPQNNMPAGVFSLPPKPDWSAGVGPGKYGQMWCKVWLA